jgi:hypothetical protein
MSSLSVSWQQIYNAGTITVSLNYTLQILHLKSSQPHSCNWLFYSQPPVQNWTLNWTLYYSFLWRLRVLDSRLLRYDRLLESESESYVTTDGQPDSLSWNKAPFWGLRPDLYYCQTVAGLLIWGVLSDEMTGLSFTIAAGPRQRSHFRVRVS